MLEFLYIPDISYRPAPKGFLLKESFEENLYGSKIQMFLEGKSLDAH